MKFEPVARALHRLDLAKYGINKISIDLATEYEDTKVKKGIRLERRRRLGRVTMVYTWQREHGTELTLKEVSSCSSTSITHVLENVSIDIDITLYCEVMVDAVRDNRKDIADALGVVSYQVFLQPIASSAFV